MSMSEGGYWTLFRQGWWKVGLFSALVGVAAALIVLRMPSYYQAGAVVTPIGDEGKSGPNLGGALASFGFSIGTSSKLEDLDSLFRSKDLAVRVFSKHDIWSSVAGDRWDPKSGILRKSWLGGLFDRIAGEAEGAGGKKPTEWDAIRASKKAFQIMGNKKADTLTLSFESFSAAGSAAIAGYYLEEAKNRLQEEALERAGRNKRFIEEQISRSYDPLVRDRLYTLYGQEVEREMMAKNREQFGFRMLDSPRTPDFKSRPARVKTVGISMALAAMLGFFFLILRRP